MRGKRVDQNPENKDQWPFPVLQLGEYGKGLDGRWYCVPPKPIDHPLSAGNRFLGNLSRHEVTEHKDGTITVSPSILIESGKLGSWHGFLEKGIWRECK